VVISQRKRTPSPPHSRGPIPSTHYSNSTEAITSCKIVKVQFVAKSKCFFFLIAPPSKVETTDF
jgi:hypothetical protein